MYAAEYMIYHSYPMQECRVDNGSYGFCLVLSFASVIVVYRLCSKQCNALSDLRQTLRRHAGT